MKITDEQLSAFLDLELPEVEMEAIRELLLEDEALADRLAELALVDELVAASARQIDNLPVSEAVHALLRENKSTQVITFPLWKRIQLGLQLPLAIAASIALVISFGVAQILRSNNHNDWLAVAQVLETAPSGLVKTASNGVEVKPRLTFKNHQGEYCRQFDLQDARGRSENIACRQGSQWQLTSSVLQGPQQTASEYQTASGGSALDEVLEQMVAGDIFNAQRELEVIDQHW